MRVALRVAYDGEGLAGSQRQPHGNTVEDELLRAMRAVGAVEDAKQARFGMAARTDRGVSALANVAAFDTDLPVEAVLPAVAGRLSRVWPWGVAVVDDAFDARRDARSRTYHYLAPAGADLAAAQSAFAVFEGTHDLSGFCKRWPGVTYHRRTIHEARVEAAGDHWRFVVRANAFLWQQVRRMVGAALEVGGGLATVDDVRTRLERGDGAPFPTAPPEPLVLVDVEHGIEWRTDDAALARVLGLVGRRASEAATRAAVLEGLHARMVGRR